MVRDALDLLAQSRLLTSVGIRVRIIASIASSLAFCSIALSPAFAQITPDDTLGTERSIVVEDVVPGIDRIAGGAARGANLFHSFQRFNIGAGRAAYFANPDGIRNIIGRVTGNDPSNILGTLGVLGEANLFLMNPNGIVFGENAALDVQGSFVATTANALQFGDRGFFSATNPEMPALLTVNPSAFLFNQLPAGSITNASIAPAGTQPLGLPEFGLRVPDGENLLLVGGNISMDGGRLNAYGGRVELAGLAAPGSIGLDMNQNAFQLMVPTDRALANITLTNDAQVSVKGTGGGDIVATADRFSATNGGRLVAGVEGSGNAGTVRVNANAIGLSGIGQTGLSSAISNQSGDINLNSRSLTLQDGALIFTTNVLTQGAPGGIQIRATDAVTLQNNSSIIITGAGNNSVGANSITIDTANFTARDYSGIGILSTELEGRNGSITINAPESVTMQNNSRIVNVAGPDVSLPEDRLRTSASGNVTIDTNRFTLADNSSISSTSILTIGQSGNIAIRAGDATIRDDSTIDAVAFGGSGGNVTITADRFLAQRGSGISTTAANLRRLTTTTNPALVNESTLAVRDQFVATAARLGNLDVLEQGRSGNITIRATDSVELNDVAADRTPSFLSSGSDAGDAGDITIEAGSIRVRNGATIESTTSGNGRGGNLSLTADSIEVTGFTPTVTANAPIRLPSLVQTTSNASATGNAGNVTIQTNRLLVGGGAGIDASTVGQGQGGSIRIVARDSVDLVGATDLQSPLLQSTLGSSSNGTGNAGTITIQTDQLRLRNGGQISATAGNAGRGGDITINANAIDFSGVTIDGQFINNITSSSTEAATGDAGNITLNTGSLRIRDGGLIFASTLGTGQGGEIRIAAREGVDVLGYTFSPTLGQVPSLITTTSTGQGDAGNIQIVADRLRVLNGGVISAATTGAGRGGNLTITATDGIDVIGAPASPIPNDSLRSSLVTDTNSTGNAGAVTLVTNRLRIRDGAMVSANANGAGAGGDIRIRANEIEVSGLSEDRTSISAISSTNTLPEATGNAGTIVIATDRLAVRGGAQISAITLGGGQGGNLIIAAGDTIEVSGRGRLADGEMLASGLRTDSARTGNAGDITVVTDRLQLQDRGSISASTGGTGRGGTIRIAAREMSLTGGAVLSAQSRSTGQAGDINIQIDDRLSMENSRMITAANRSSGGSISVEAGDIRLRGNSNIQTNVNQGRETGGNIRLAADSIVAFDDSDILAFARDGRGGNITLDTPAFFGEGYSPEASAAPGELDRNDRVDVNASGSLESGVIRLPDVSFIQNSLAEIPDNTIDPDRLIANSCIARNSSSGTFVITGSGGLPERPGDGAASSYPTGDVQPVPENGQEDGYHTEVNPSYRGEPVVEPQGVFQLEDGRLVISRFCSGE